MSLNSGRLPTCLKTSTIISIAKIPKSCRPGDFRPINLLPVVDKILEKIVCTQLRRYFECNNLLYIGQSGFRSKHSCESALQYVCAVWRKNINEQKKIFCGFETRVRNH
nr:unnamed protein product [Callosobruchus chinensis]